MTRSVLANLADLTNQSQVFASRGRRTCAPVYYTYPAAATAREVNDAWGAWAIDALASQQLKYIQMRCNLFLKSIGATHVTNIVYVQPLYILCFHLLWREQSDRPYVTSPGSSASLPHIHTGPRDTPKLVKIPRNHGDESEWARQQIARGTWWSKHYIS